MHVFGDIPADRYSHCMGAVGSKVLLFGGMNLNKFCSAEVWSLETEESFVNDCVKGWNKLMNKKREYNKIRVIEKLGMEKVRVSSKEIKGTVARMLIPDMVEIE